MPRIEMSDLFGENVPEGLDLEKTGEALDQRIEALLEDERKGVRSSVDKQLKELQDEKELMQAQLEDLKSGKGTPTPDPSSATEPGSRAEAIRKRQADEAAEAKRQADIAAAVNRTKSFYKVSAEAVKAGVPESVIALAGEDPDELSKLTTMYQAMNPNAGKGDGKKEGSGNLRPSNNEQVNVEDPEKMTSLDRVMQRVQKLPTATLQGGSINSLDS